MPADVQVLKIDVPHNATPATPWHITSLAKYRYYFPEVRRNGSLQENGYIGGKQHLQPDAVAPGTDVHVLAIDRAVSVTPLSLDMTSRGFAPVGAGHSSQILIGHLRNLKSIRLDANAFLLNQVYCSFLMARITPSSTAIARRSPGSSAENPHPSHR